MKLLKAIVRVALSSFWIVYWVFFAGVKTNIPGYSFIIFVIGVASFTYMIVNLFFFWRYLIKWADRGSTSKTAVSISLETRSRTIANLARRLRWAFIVLFIGGLLLGSIVKDAQSNEALLGWFIIIEVPLLIAAITTTIMSIASKPKAN